MNGTSQIFTLKSAMYSSLRIFVDVMLCRTYYTMKIPAVWMTEPRSVGQICGARLAAAFR